MLWVRPDTSQEGVPVSAGARALKLSNGRNGRLAVATDCDCSHAAVGRSFCLERHIPDGHTALRLGPLKFMS